MANKNSRNSSKSTAGRRPASGAKGSGRGYSSAKRSGSGAKRSTAKKNENAFIAKYREIMGGDDNRSRIIRTSVKIALVLLAILLIVTGWRNRYDCSWTNTVQSMRDMPYMTGIGSGYPISVLGGDALAQEKIANGMAVLTDTNLTIYNTSSKQVASRAHYMTNPAMKTAGRFGLLMDIGGTKYRLEAISDTLIEQKSQNVIIGGAVARNGKYVIVTQDSSHTSSELSIVEGFNPDGESFHLWRSEEQYITEAAFSADASYLALSGVWAKEGELVTNIIIQKIGDKTAEKRIEIPNALGLSLQFTNTGTLYAVCDNCLVVIEGYGAEHKIYEYNGTLQAYDISFENGAAVYTAPVVGEPSGILTAYDSRGQKRFDKEVPLYGVSLSIGDNNCCVLGRGGAVAYHLSGEKLNSWDTGISAENILVVGNRAYVIEGISIEQYKIG